MVRQQNKTQINQLVNLIKEHNEEGFNILYTNYSHAIYSIILNVVAHTETAEDLLYHTFISIWENVNSYNELNCPFFAWIIGITRKTCTDYIEANKANNGWRDVKTLAMGNYYFLTKIDACETQDIDNTFCRDTEALYLIYFYGYNYEETANILCLPVADVVADVRRSVNRIRKVY